MSQDQNTAAQGQQTATTSSSGAVVESIPVDGCICSPNRKSPAPNCWAKTHDSRYYA